MNFPLQSSSRRVCRAHLAGRTLPAATALLLVAASTVGFRTGAKDWVEFRGPTGQGIADSKKLPLEWSDTRNVAWKREIPGAGWSSPVVAKGKLYLTTLDGGVLKVISLDARSGESRWTTDVFTPKPEKLGKGHSKNSDASPTPIVEGNRIYVHFGHLGTACLDTSGRIVWRNDSIVYPPVHGNGGSPAIAGDRLIFSCDGGSDPFVIALNKRTGEVAWKTPRSAEPKKRFSFSTPLVIEVAGRPQVVSPGSGAVCAYDPKDGREIWRARYGEGYSVVPRPIYANGRVYLATGFDRPSVLAVRVDGSGDVTDSHVEWTVSRGAPNTPSLVMKGDDLFFVSDAGIASCVSAKTGESKWSERLGGNFSASPILAGNRVYFQSEEGVGYVVAAGAKFELLAKNDLKERTLASAAVDGDALFLRGDKHLYRIEAR